MRLSLGDIVIVSKRGNNDSQPTELMASTQSVHDRVNLLRMVTRLEDEVERRQTWGSTGISAWVKASNVAQVIATSLSWT